MLELINILLDREDFYSLLLRFDYYGIPSERGYYIFFVGNPFLAEKDGIVINYKCIEDIIKYV